MASLAEETPASTLIGDRPAGRSQLLVLMFTDLIGSVGIKDALTTPGYLPLLRRHDALLRDAVASFHGRIQQDTGDGGFAVFATSSDAVSAALRFQWLLNTEAWPDDRRLSARVGIHLGEVAETDVQQDGGNKLVGLPIDLAARVMSLAAGGQILMTRSAFNDSRQFVAAHPCERAMPLKWIAHGPYLFKGSSEAIEVFEVGLEGKSPLTAPTDCEKARRAPRAGDEEILGWRPAIGLALPGSSAWLLEKKIGQGGFGEVWLARHAKAKSIRVLKFCFDADRLRALKREVALFRLLKETLGDRRDISRVIDWRLDEAPYFIEMDYAPEGNLADWADRQGGVEKIPFPRRLAMVAEIARALSAAHSVGILHKDIKPSNILIVQDADGTFFPRLTDFGIGILTDKTRLKDLNITGDGFTSTALVTYESSGAGTRMYAPTESLSDKPHTVQGDVYALGIVLYQMIVGDLSRPLGVGWERKVSDEFLREDIAACVDVDPALRLSSAAALADRLETLDARRAERRRIAKLAETARSARRRRAQVRVLVAISVLLSGIGFAIGYLWREALRQGRAAVSFAERARIGEERAVKGETQAVQNAALADANAGRASRNEAAAVENARSAELRLAEGLVAQGVAFGAAGRWEAAKNAEWKAYDKFNELRVSPFRAEAALCVALDASPPPLLTLKHNFQVHCVAVSPDGRTVLTSDGVSTLKLWELRTGRLLKTIAGSKVNMPRFAFSPDGQTALTWGGEDRSFIQLDLAHGSVVHTFLGHLQKVTDATFASNGRFALSGSMDKTLRLWDLTTGKEVRVMNGYSGGITCLGVSPDGHTAVASDSAEVTKVWDLERGTEIRTLPNQPNAVRVGFVPNFDQRIFILSGGGFKEFDWRTGDERMAFADSASKDSTTGAISLNGTAILRAYGYGEISLVDLDSRRMGEVRKFTNHSGSVLSLEWCGDGRTVVSGSNDQTVKVWCMGTYRIDRAPSRIWTLAAGADVRMLIGHTSTRTGVAISPDGRTAISCSEDRTVRLWDVATGRELRTFVGHTDTINGVNFTPDGRSALSCSRDSTLRLWNLSSGEEIRSLTGHTGRVTCQAVSHDGRIAVSGGDDKTLKVWDLATGAEIRTISTSKTARGGGVDTLALSLDERTALVGSLAAPVRLWDLTTGTECSAHINPAARLCLVLCRDGTRALSSSTYEQTTKLWDLATGAVIRAFHGRGDASSLALSPDGLTMMSGINGHSLTLFDIESGGEICTLAAAGGHSVTAFGPDGRTAVADGPDLKLWDFSRVARYREFEPQIARAQATLQDKPDDADSLAALGEWYAFRGQNEWAIELLEKARAGGVSIDPLELARCYWQVSDSPSPLFALTRQECLTAARREFGKALERAKDEPEKFYLQLCTSAVDRAMAPPAAGQAAQVVH